MGYRCPYFCLCAFLGFYKSLTRRKGMAMNPRPIPCGGMVFHPDRWCHDVVSVPNLDFYDYCLGLKV